MHVHRMLALAAYIETLPKRKFDMTNYLTWDHDKLHNNVWLMARNTHLVEKFEECGTAGCIAGWATVLAGQMSGTFHDTAAEWLGLTEEQSEELFMGHWPGGRDDADLNPKATPKQAAKAIRRMVREYERDGI